MMTNDHVSHQFITLPGNPTCVVTELHCTSISEAFTILQCAVPTSKVSMSTHLLQ